MNIVDLVNMDVGYSTVFNRKKTTVMDKLSLNLSTISAYYQSGWLEIVFFFMKHNLTLCFVYTD